MKISKKAFFNGVAVLGMGATAIMGSGAASAAVVSDPVTSPITSNDVTDGRGGSEMHVAGSYSPTKAPCVKAAINYANAVHAKGFDDNYQDGTKPSGEECKLYEGGWSYVIYYGGTQLGSSIKTQGTMPGDEINWGVDKYTPFYAGLRLTTWTHGAYSFATKAQCVNAYNGVVAKVNAAGDKAQLVTDENAVIHGTETRSCTVDGSGKWSYQVGYNAKSKGNLFPYDTYVTTDELAHVVAKGTALPGGVYQPA